MSNAVSQIIPYTIRDTGITIKIRKVSPLLAMELTRAFPAPTPPMQEVKIGDEVRMEPNPAHPDYLKAQAQYQADFESKMRKLIIDRGVVIELDEAQQAEVKELREYWQESYGIALPGNDREVYISYIALGTDVDLTELIDAIMRRSQPTESGVGTAQDSFRG